MRLSSQVARNASDDILMLEDQFKCQMCVLVIDKFSFV